MSSFRVVLSILLVAAVPASADVYKWTDAQGRMHYSDSAPPETKTQQVNVRVNSISGPAVVSKLSNAVPSTGKQSVRLLTTPWCGYCKKAKALLVSKGIPYEEVDVEGTDRGRDEFKRLGGHGVPIILVGNQRMDGFDAAQLNSMLQKAGW